MVLSEAVEMGEKETYEVKNIDINRVFDQNIS